MPRSDLDHPDDDAERLGYESMGRCLRASRAQAGWTQRELQALSGVDQAVISRLENAKQRVIRWRRFGRLVGTLGGLEPIGRPPWLGVGHRDRDADPEP